ncbi:MULTISPECIES: DUF1905 domain-containing protein [Amycolatopsis]|uniref:DUF1905 domain-containing protein n=1 Tax=Amycolatopsis albidoflavus TaxID=102226 RepID=A0ABW5HWZ7_9PSEU
MEVHFDAELWIWNARRTDTWTFVALPGDISGEAARAATCSR